MAFLTLVLFLTLAPRLTFVRLPPHRDAQRPRKGAHQEFRIEAIGLRAGVRATLRCSWDGCHKLRHRVSEATAINVKGSAHASGSAAAIVRGFTIDIDQGSFIIQVLKENLQQED
jgi:hypothetical protein